MASAVDDSTINIVVVIIIIIIIPWNSFETALLHRFYYFPLSLLLCHVYGVSVCQVLTSSAAVNVLWELSPGGALMHASSQQQLQRNDYWVALATTLLAKYVDT